MESEGRKILLRTGAEFIVEGFRWAYWDKMRKFYLKPRWAYEKFDKAWVKAGLKIEFLRCHIFLIMFWFLCDFLGFLWKWIEQQRPFSHFNFCLLVLESVTWFLSITYEVDKKTVPYPYSRDNNCHHFKVSCLLPFSTRNIFAYFKIFPFIVPECLFKKELGSKNVI